MFWVDRSSNIAFVEDNLGNGFSQPRVVMLAKKLAPSTLLLSATVTLWFFNPLPSLFFSANTYIVVHFLTPLALPPPPALLVGRAYLPRCTATPYLPQGSTHTVRAVGLSAPGSRGSRAWRTEPFSFSLEQLSRALEL